MEYLIGLATNAAHPHLTEDDQLLQNALIDAGHKAIPVVWGDAEISWDAFDLVVIRSCWDYHLRLEAFTEWLMHLDAVGTKTANASSLLRWNSNKTYLKEIGDRGFDIVPTIWGDTLSRHSIKSLMKKKNWQQAVIKPVVSASAMATATVRLENVKEGIDYFSGLSPEDMMMQRFMPEIVSKGEWSLVFFNAESSHSIIKIPAAGDFRTQSELGASSKNAAPPPGLIHTAQKLLQSLPTPPTYARVDGLEVDGRFVLMELELIEPHLFLGMAEGAAKRFAEAILEQLS